MIQQTELFQELDAKSIVPGDFLNIYPHNGLIG